jgi:hypothetical protein
MKLLSQVLSNIRNQKWKGSTNGLIGVPLFTCQLVCVSWVHNPISGARLFVYYTGPQLIVSDGHWR